MIRFEENKDDVKEFIALYNAVGWEAYSEEISRKALQANIYSVSIYDGDRIIGYGRILGDGIIYLHIHNVMVDPKYQNQKIGTMIMDKLLLKIDELRKLNPGIKVYLGATPNKEGFYEKFGFVNRDKKELGSGMILDK